MAQHTARRAPSAQAYLNRSAIQRGAGRRRTRIGVAVGRVVISAVVRVRICVGARAAVGVHSCPVGVGRRHLSAVDGDLCQVGGETNSDRLHNNPRHALCSTFLSFSLPLSPLPVCRAWSSTKCRGRRKKKNHVLQGWDGTLSPHSPSPEPRRDGNAAPDSWTHQRLRWERMRILMRTWLSFRAFCTKGAPAASALEGMTRTLTSTKNDQTSCCNSKKKFSPKWQTLKIYPI